MAQLAGRPPRTFRGRPVASYVIDPYVVAAVAAVIVGTVTALRLSLPAAVIGAALVAGWSSAWSP